VHGVPAERSAQELIAGRPFGHRAAEVVREAITPSHAGSPAICTRAAAAASRATVAEQLTLGRIPM